MFRYKLRTLLIVLALGPPMLAGGWWTRQAILARSREAQFKEIIDLIQATLTPDDWERLGGPSGSMDSYSSNCFLIQSADEPDAGPNQESESH